MSTRRFFPARAGRARVSALLLAGSVALVLFVALCPRPAGARDPITHAVAGLSTGLAGDVSLDRSTPRRTLDSFLSAARDGDFTAASHCLDLRGVTDASQGPVLAEELSYVLYRRPAINLGEVSDDAAKSAQVTVESFTVGDQEVPLSLSRVKFDDGVQRWVISSTTVRRIPDIAATLRTAAWEQKLPRALRTPVVLGNAPWQWIGIVVSVFVSYGLGRLFAAIVSRIGRSFARRTKTLIDDLLVETAGRPLRTIFASILFAALLYALQVSLPVDRLLGHFAYTGFILGLAWLLLAVFNLIARLIAPPPETPVDLHDAAGERTRRALLQRVASAGIVGVTVALLLLQFDVVRHVGLSLLASAGIAGVVLGLAAQKSLAGLIAGIQLSITQPIRLGDVVFIENEMGTVEDIFLTYAVIRYWDDRCVVVPLSRFLEQPFQNWTLLRRELTAVVLMHVKFTAPIAQLRAKLHEICVANPKWDQRRCELQVGDSDMSGLILRIMVSARTPAEAFDLKGYVREGLFTYMQTLEGGIHLG